MTDALADVTREDFLAWADEAQSVIDGNEMLISDMRKAKATVALLRQAAAPQALAATPAVIDRKMIETVIGEFAIDNRELSYLEMEPEEFSRRIMEKIKAKPTATPAVAGEIMRDKLAELQNAGVKSLTINQIVGLLGFSETEAAQPASPLRGRVPTLLRDALQQVHDFMMEDHKIGDSGLWTEPYAELFDVVDAALSASPPEQPETRQQKNEREMAKGSRCDGSCNDGMPCHCQPAADPVTGREALEHLGNAVYFCADIHPDDRNEALNNATAYYNEQMPRCKVEPSGHGYQRLVDPPLPTAPEPELPKARPMGQS